MPPFEPVITTQELQDVLTGGTVKSRDLYPVQAYLLFAIVERLDRLADIIIAQPGPPGPGEL